MGSSVDEWAGCEIPFVPAGWLHQTMRIKKFHCVIKVLSPHCAKTKIICTVDPKVSVPRAVVNYAIKKLAGLLLYLLQSQAAFIRDNPECPHGLRIRQNRAFYQEWLLPKITALCELRGWDQPSMAYFQ